MSPHGDQLMRCRSMLPLLKATGRKYHVQAASSLFRGCCHGCSYYRCSLETHMAPVELSFKVTRVEAQEQLRSGTKAVLMSHPDCRRVGEFLYHQSILTRGQRWEMRDNGIWCSFPFVLSTFKKNLISRIFNFKRIH